MRNRLLLAALCGVLALLPACGKKGPVRPLLKAVPAAVGEVQLRQLGEEFLLGWTPPQRNQDGTPLRALQGYRIERQSFDPADDCPTCNAGSELWRVIDLDFPTGVQRDGERLLVRDGEVENGLGYRYRIVPFDSAGYPGEESQIAQVCQSPPPPPEGVGALPFDRMVRLSWQAPATTETIVGYNLYRSEGDAPFGTTPLNLALITALRFDDIGPRNSTTYRYFLRSVARRGEALIESTASASVAAIPKIEE